MQAFSASFFAAFPCSVELKIRLFWPETALEMGVKFLSILPEYPRKEAMAAFPGKSTQFLALEVVNGQ